MNTQYTDTIAHAFADEIEFRPVQDTLRDTILKVSAIAGSGLAMTALLAFVLR